MMKNNSDEPRKAHIGGYIDASVVMAFHDYALATRQNPIEFLEFCITYALNNGVDEAASTKLRMWKKRYEVASIRDDEITLREVTAYCVENSTNENFERLSSVCDMMGRDPNEELAKMRESLGTAQLIVENGIRNQAELWLIRNLPSNMQRAANELFQLAIPEGITQKQLEKARSRLGWYTERKSSGFYWSREHPNSYEKGAMRSNGNGEKFEEQVF